MKSRRFYPCLAAILVIVVVLLGAFLGTRAYNRSSADAEQVVFPTATEEGEVFWRISAGPANAWLLPLEEGYFLIDTGYPEDYDRFQIGLEFMGIEPRDIRFIFITHAHDEHVGFATRLRQETGAVLVLPEDSLPALRSGQFQWNGVSVNRLVHVLSMVYNTLSSRNFFFDPVIPSDDDVILRGTEDDICREWGLEGRFVHTPGHSSDSWSLILDDGRAFVGDAAMNTLGFAGTGYRPLFMEDRHQVYVSLDRIRSAGARRVLTGHGPSFPVENLPISRAMTDSGPGISALPLYVVKLIPGLFLALLLLVIGRKGGLGFRIWIYILGFVLIRDVMTPMGFWTLGGDPVFWMRFAADGALLTLLAVGSLGMGLSVLFYERRKGLRLPWFTGKTFPALFAGLVGVLVVTLPVWLSYRGILPEERGGLFPRSLIPAVFAVALAGNFLEELLFRGYLQSWLADQGIKPIGAALASGIAFGLCHSFLAFTVTDVGIGLLLFATWEGMICGLLRHKFGVVSAIMTHGLAVAVISIM